MIFLLIWYFIGVIFVALTAAHDRNEFTFGDLMISVFLGIIGPLAIVVYLIVALEDVVLFDW
jgi:hypothetical protein